MQNDVLFEEDAVPERPVVVAIMYPPQWDARPAEQLEQDVRALADVDPGIEVVDARYVEPDALRTRRGADPGADLRSEAPPIDDAVRAALARAEIVLTQDLPFDVAALAPNLRWVQGMGAGVSQLLSAGLGGAGIRLTTAAGVNAVSIAEFVMARLLQIAKRLPEIDRHQRDRRWEPTYGREIAGSTLGVVGLGAIGREVARRGRALGLRIVASRQSWRPGMKDDDVDQLYGPDDLLTMLGAADMVVSAVPETAATVDLFDAAAFAAMRPGAVFCNVGRGSAVVEEALVDALESGHLAAAAIDVARDEPLPPASPLWDVANLYVSPHSATSPDRFWANLHALFRDNVARYLAGEPLRNEVDARIGA
jgi:phosphoglycerate dehydrogenase-like enzyme